MAEMCQLSLGPDVASHMRKREREARRSFRLRTETE